MHLAAWPPGWATRKPAFAAGFRQTISA